MTTKIALRSLKMAGHAMALVFGAFWLVATSAPDVPARDCFTGITNPATLQVVLGTPPTSDGGTSGGEQSCNGIDGLAPGSTVTLSLSQGPRPNALGGCWNYQTTSIQGTTGVIVSTSQVGSNDLTDVFGAYASPTAKSCRGDWTFSLGTSLVPAQVVSPLDAGPTQPWFVHRSIDIDQAQFCDGAFTASGPVNCEDTFPVTSITEVAP
jgi:hypothetical protein